MATPLLELHYTNATNRDIAAYPVTQGVPFALGVLHDQDLPDLAISRADGSLAPLQTQVTERHADGSIAWLLLDFALPVRANEAGRVGLVRGPAPTSTGVQVTTSTAPASTTVTTSRLRAEFGPDREAGGGFSLFRSLQVDGREIVASGCDIVVEDSAGKLYYASLSRQVSVDLTVSGPQRSVVELRGRHTAEDGSELFDFRLRYTFRPDASVVKLAYKFTNREAPETGVSVRAIRIELPTALGRTTTKRIRQSHTGATWFSRQLEIGENVELFNAGAVNEAAKATYGAFAEGKVLIRNLGSLGESLGDYPHFLRPGNARTDMTGGLRQVQPYLGAVGPGGALLAWFAKMEYHYPKAVRMARHTLTWDIWPATAGDCQVRRGQSKEHDLYLALWADDPGADAMEGAYFDHELNGYGAWGGPQESVSFTLDPAYVRGTALLELHRYLPDRVEYIPVEAKLGSAGATSSVANRGFWDIGDSVRPDRSWCHNNENDAILQALTEYLRKADASYLYTACLKATHNAHVDFIAHDPDPLRQGTMPAHCPEHTDGAAYPSHMWVDGLIAAWCLTGEPDYRDAALSVGANMRRWQTDRPEIFYCDSRECGWPMLAYLCLHRHTGERRWLDYADEVFAFYAEHMTDAGEILYELPHGLGITKQGYGEFITWRAVFRFWERTGREDVRAFLVRCLTLPAIYRVTPQRIARGGWACNDLFPAWAASQVTGDDRYIAENIPILRYLMDRAGGFPWGGVDMHYYLNALHDSHRLADLC